MEGNQCISFGDFTEDENFIYFSDEVVKSSGIEFPPDFHVPNFARKSNKVKQNAGEEFTSEFSDLCERSTDHTSLETSEVLVLENELYNDDKRQTFESNNVDVEEFSNGNGSNLSNLNTSYENGGDKSNLFDKENYVVTVGTKTMLTTSTRTVESRNKTVKSSWADLFKTKSSSKQQEPLPLPVQNHQNKLSPDQNSVLNDHTDQLTQYFSDVLQSISLSHKVPLLQPRGLKNNGNWCYINSTLQVLLYCPSFYHFIMKFKVKTARGVSQTPILDALVMFASEFSEVSANVTSKKLQNGSSKNEVVLGMSFEPVYVYKLLHTVKTTISQQGKQEDAEEFLSCILNGLHEEIVKIQHDQRSLSEEVPAAWEQVSGDWEEVGPRNKSTVTCKAAMSKTPVAAMFGGYLRSSLVQAGMKESASIQPFFTIPLDLRGDLNKLQQAFDNFFQVEEVEGFQCDKSKAEIEVSKRWTLDTLPAVLVLHLKRFIVGRNGCEKLVKKITYEQTLEVSLENLSKINKVRNKNMLTYKLFAVTYHHGKNLNGGHYSSDILHPAFGWLRADDMNVRLIPTKFVFNPLSNRDPYLLYYCRGDIAV